MFEKIKNFCSKKELITVKEYDKIVEENCLLKRKIDTYENTLRGIAIYLGNDYKKELFPYDIKAILLYVVVNSGINNDVSKLPYYYKWLIEK